MNSKPSPLVAVLMGSRSDWDTMSHCAQTLDSLGISHEVRVLSAHRTPDEAARFAETAESRGIKVIIAAAGGAAHLAGAMVAKSALPILGVPLDSSALKGLDALLATVQMPAGVPVGTLAIGKPGAINAALLAAAILALSRPEIREALGNYRHAQTRKVLEQPDPREPA